MARAGGVGRWGALALLLASATASSGCGSASVAAGAAGVVAAGGLYSANRHEVRERGPYFLRDSDQGTDAYAGPFDVLLNKGFATAQWEGRSRNIFSYPYGWGRTVRSLIDVDEAIRNSGGWSTVVTTQIVPLTSSGWRTWAWVPNYYGHLIEGGIANRRLKEWYQARGVGPAGLAAGLTTWAAAFLNEAYETPGEGGPDGGVTVDLLLFDIGGILLFDVDAVSRFFARNLRASIWPTQASIMLNDGRLMNNAHHLVLKLPVGISDRFSLFLKSGIGFEAGLSVHLPDGLDLTVAGGAQSRHRFIDPFTKLETAEFATAGGVWVDRRGRLLWSLLVEPHTDRAVALNLYPGLDGRLGDLGAWISFDRAGRPAFGVTARRSMGLGVGLGF